MQARLKLFHLPVTNAILWACTQRDPFSRYSATVRKVLSLAMGSGVYEPRSLLNVPLIDRPTVLSLLFPPEKLRALNRFIDGLRLPMPRTQVMLNLLLDHMAADVATMPAGWEPCLNKHVGKRRNLRLLLPADVLIGLNQLGRERGMLVGDLLDDLLTNHAEDVPPVNYQNGTNLRRLKLGDIPGTLVNYRVSEEADLKLLTLSAGTRASAPVFIVDLLTNYIRYRNQATTQPARPDSEAEFPPLDRCAHVVSSKG